LLFVLDYNPTGHFVPFFYFIIPYKNDWLFINLIYILTILYFNSSIESTLIPLNTLLAILLKKHLTMFSHEARFGVNTNSNLSGIVLMYSRTIEKSCQQPSISICKAAKLADA